MSQQQSAPPPGDDEIDLGYLFAVCQDNKYLILAITLFFTVAGAAYALLATPIYQADALLQVERRSGTPVGLDLAMLGQEPTASSTQSEILRSRMIMSQAAAQAGLDLVIRPHTVPVIGDTLLRRGVSRPGYAQGWSSVWAGEAIQLAEMNLAEELKGRPFTLEVLDADRYLLHDETGKQLGTGRVNELFSIDAPYLELLVTELTAPAKARFTLIKRSEAGMTRYLRSRFNVAERGGRDTGILEISLTGPDREEITRSVNAIADVYLLQNINRQAAEAESRLEFLERQTPQVQLGLNSAEEALNQYRASQESVDLSFETRSMLENLVRVEAELNDLEFQETELAQRFTRSHPSYRSLLERRAQLQAQRSRLEAQVESLPETQRQVLRLNRDVEVSQQIYMQMLNSMQELRIARAGTIGNVRILDRGLASENMIAPRRSLIVIIALMGGLMAGLMVVLVRHMLKRGVESVEQLQSVGLQVYATVPLSDNQTKLSRRVGAKAKKQHKPETDGGVLAWVDPADLAIESLRSLRTSLHFAMLEASDNRLMLTGPSPAVGKSFVSANLAAVCGQAGQKVLLIDADLRKGHVHQVFGEQGGNGLSDLLVGRIDSEATIRKTGHPELDYVARGTIPPNPSELLMHPRFTEFLDEVSKRYDLVIIDTPPILAVTDAAIVGKQAATTLMIVRYQESSPKEVERAAQSLEASGVHVKGAILNAVQRSATAYYGYGYYHYTYKTETA